jgi:hypothetical protein
MKNLRIELLQNGFYRVFDYSSKMSGLYTKDASYHSGDLRLAWYVIVELISTMK